MSVRSRLAPPPGPSVEIAKVFGPGTPASFRQGEEASQMTPASPFSPGTPIGPYDGYDRTPRSHDFVTGYNIATRPRIHERVSFEALKGIIGAYDVARICIRTRIGSIRSLDWKLVSALDFSGDVTEYVPKGMAALKRPDRKTLFKPWLAKYLRDTLSYDAGTLYRMRNRGGRCVGLKVVDGTTIAPLQDYWGDPPDPPAESHVQFVNGLPWNWLTRDDLIYEPFEPAADSLYGVAPIEDIILNANTDLRFQVYFLQRFTDGNLPAAFASAPDSWSPDQIEQFQAYWDAMMFGNQAGKHQVKWMPPGSKFVWSNEKDFSDTFSLFLMRKTCAAYNIVPSDLGFTEDVNRSSGESQADVAHRVGDLPMIHHVQDILTAWLQDDLGLPLRFLFDIGENQDDRYQQAQADQVYMDRAVVSSTEIRELRYGLTDTEPVPRVFFTERSGPIPISSLAAVAGEIDPQTAAPEPGAPLPHQVFEDAPGVVPQPPLYSQPLAEEIYGPKAIPPHTETQSTMPVAKEGEAAPGITSETGIYGYDLQGRDEDEEPGEAAQVAKELAAFRRFERARRKNGEWRDFRFRHVAPGEARHLNETGRRAVRKDAAGYDLSPNSGMISLDLPEGAIEPVPGGVTDHHVTVVYLGPDVDDGAYAVACQRAATAAAAMPGPLAAEVGGIGSFPPSGSSDGKVPAWAGVLMPGAERLRDALADLSASEHADWKPHVTLAYVEPGDPLPARVPQTQVTFTHLSVHRGDDVACFPLGAPPVPDCCGGECCQGDGGCCAGSGGCTCGTPSEGAESVCPCGTPVVYDEMNGWQHGDGSVSHDDGESVSDKMASIAKAGGPPKGDPDDWSGIWARTHERRTRLLAKHERAVLAAWNDLAGNLSPRALVRQFREDAGLVVKLADESRPWWKDRGRDAALAWLTALQQKKGWAALVTAIGAAIADGMAEGEADSLAVAADRQGVEGFPVAAAFTAAAQALQGDPEVSQKAQDTAQAILEGTAAALSVTLADGAEDGTGEAGMAAAVTSAVTGPDVSPVRFALADALWSAAGDGLTRLIGKLMGGSPAPAEGAPPSPPPEEPEAGPAFINWVCEGGSPCPACLGNQDGSPYMVQDTPSYPQHRHCECALYLASHVPSSFFAAYLLN